MKIDVIMPAFNAAHTIVSAVTSILRQRDACDVEVIVIDDGSTDGTDGVIRTLQAQGGVVRLIERKHAGISCSRNAGLRALRANADCITFLDADDLSPSGRLARDIAVIRADPRVDLVYGRVAFFDHEDAAALLPSRRSNLTVGRAVQLGAGVYRRSLIEVAGSFDETLRQSEDFEYLTRLFEAADRFHLSDDIGVFYRRNHGSISDNRTEARNEMMRAALKVRMRQAKSGRAPILPPNLFTNDHIAELRSWTR